MTKKKKRNQFHKFAHLSGAGLQMGITIYLGAYFGKKLDLYLETDSRTYTMVLTLLAVCISIYSIIRQLKKINDKYD